MKAETGFVQLLDYTTNSDANIVTGSIAYTKNVFCAADEYKKVHLWSTRRPEPKLTLSGCSSEITNLKYSRSTYNVFAGTSSGTVYSWDLQA